MRRPILATLGTAAALATLLGAKSYTGTSPGMLPMAVMPIEPPTSSTLPGGPGRAHRVRTTGHPAAHRSAAATPAAASPSMVPVTSASPSPTSSASAATPTTASATPATTSTSAAATAPGTPAASAPASPTPSPSHSPSHSPSPSPSHSPSPSPSPAPKPVTTNGPVVSTPYGPVQVQITTLKGRITQVRALQHPSGSPQSDQINSYAIPKLNQETMQAQSANIDMVSGASYTSAGYIQSLQSALDQARR